jgi:hypothetical protein
MEWYRSRPCQKLSRRLAVKESGTQGGRQGSRGYFSLVGQWVWEWVLAFFNFLFSWWTLKNFREEEQNVKSKKAKKQKSKKAKKQKSKKAKKQKSKKSKKSKKENKK